MNPKDPKDIAKLITEDPDILSEEYCNSCGGWDKKQGGTGHKYGCPKGGAGIPIAALVDDTKEIALSIRDQVINALHQNKSGWYVEPWVDALNKYLTKYTLAMSVDENDDVKLTLYDYIDDPVAMNKPGIMVGIPDIERAEIYAASKNMVAIDHVCKRMTEMMADAYKMDTKS